MAIFIFRRLLMSLFVLIMVTLVIFFAMRLLPGDPLIIYVAESQQLASMSPEGLEKLRKEFGLDKPIMVQYANWIYGVIHGDFGNSIFFHATVGSLLLERFPPTIYLGLMAFAVIPVYVVIYNRARKPLSTISKELRHTNSCLYGYGGAVYITGGCLGESVIRNNTAATVFKIVF